MTPDFFKSDQGLIPAVIQDAETHAVLMLGYMNAEAYQKTCEEGRVTFFSRSKNRLWTKGETSGHFLEVDSIRLDCDRDTLLIQARAAGPVCHTGNDTCFGEKRSDTDFLSYLEEVIRKRRDTPGKESYVSSLFGKGINKIAQKVGEEAVELVIEAKDHDAIRFRDEAADLLFHYLILLQAKGFSLGDITAVLKARHRD